MTSKQPRGSLRCWRPAPWPPWPEPLPPPRLPHDPPRAGPPPSLAAGPPAIIPAPLQRTSCLWVQPHQPGQHILSLLSPSDGTTGTSGLLLQGSLQRPLGVSEGCLGAASAVPLPPALQLSASRRCAPPCRAAPRGLEEPMSPSPLPALPTPPPSNMSLPGSRPRPPWGYSSGPCAPFHR